MTQTCENPLGGALPYTKFDNKLNRVFQLNKIIFYLRMFSKEVQLVYLKNICSKKKIMILILISNLTKSYFHGPGSGVSSNNRMHMMNNPHKGALCIGEALP